MKKLLLALLCLYFVTSNQVYSQASSRNGYWLPTYDTLRVFFVFAEVVNDPIDTLYNALWAPGEMPETPDIYFDPYFTDAESINGYMTKYFYEASFGEFIVLGDYYPNLIQIEYDSITSTDGDTELLDYLQDLPSSDIITQHGFTFNSNDFDHYVSPTASGQYKTINSDNKIDLMIIVWRLNSKFTTSSNGGQYNSGKAYALKEKDYFMSFAKFTSSENLNIEVMRHEIGHGLFGDNSFHTGGSGHGERTFMSSVGGYSAMSSDEKSSPVYNAWDRYRLG